MRCLGSRHTNSPVCVLAPPHFCLQGEEVMIAPSVSDEEAKKLVGGWVGGPHPLWRWRSSSESSTLALSPPCCI